MDFVNFQFSPPESLDTSFFSVIPRTIFECDEGGRSSSGTGAAVLCSCTGVLPELKTVGVVNVG